MTKRLLLGAAYSIIEPLGILHLAGLARDLGWERKIELVKNNNYDNFLEEVNNYKPNIIGFNVYSGNHTHIFKMLKNVKSSYPDIQIVVGGPHPTYFPSNSLQSADFVVMSEGFGAFRKILQGAACPGIMPMIGTERFPLPDRETFYKKYAEHSASKIKSIISMTGCPYSCTYCYNSSSPKDIIDNVPPDVAEKIAKTMGMGGRLFPKNIRSVDDVITEAKELKNRWPTKLIYFQDDVFGFDTKNWLKEFAERWPSEVGIPFHAQMRWEMTRNVDRLDLLVKAGCSGLTLAIEAANPHIRSEILDRPMRNQLIVDGMKAVISRGLKVRTEQITGLPYGATRVRTPINLEADLSLIELNVMLKEQCGGPTMAWASTLVPYAGTKLGQYCSDFGFFEVNNSNEIKDTFFERSSMRFLKKWEGPTLYDRKHDDSLWLSDEELERYRDQNQELRNLFNFFTNIPKGHILAKSYLESNEPFTFERLGKETISHLKHIGSINIISKIQDLLLLVPNYHLNKDDQATVISLLPYFASLPKSELALNRFIEYNKQGEKLNSLTLSTATRHHLYDEILYEVNL